MRIRVDPDLQHWLKHCILTSLSAYGSTGKLPNSELKHYILTSLSAYNSTEKLFTSELKHCLQVFIGEGFSKVQYKTIRQQTRGGSMCLVGPMSAIYNPDNTGHWDTSSSWQSAWIQCCWGCTLWPLALSKSGSQEFKVEMLPVMCSKAFIRS